MSNAPKPTGQAEFLLITKAKDLVKHTMLMTNEKRFPKKYRFSIVNRLHDLVIDIFQHLQEANELDIADPRECRDRLYQQKCALTKCKTVLFLIEISYENGLVSKEQCVAWTKYVLDVKYMAASWRKKDRERAAGLLQRDIARK